MITIERVNTLRAETAEDYAQLQAHVAELAQQFPGWTVTESPERREVRVERVDTAPLGTLS